MVKKEASITIEQLKDIKDNTVLWELAQAEDTPTDVLEILARHEDYFIRHYVARNPNTPVETLRAFEKDDNDYVIKWGLLCNENVPLDILERFSKDENKDIRERVAHHQKTPADILCILAKDNEKDVRQGCAWNHKVPTEILAELASDDDADVRAAVAENRGATVEILCRLAEDESDHVLRNVLFNKKTPIRIQSKLRAILSESKSRWYRIEIAKDPDTPKHLLRKLLEDKWTVASCAMENPNAPVDVLRKLSDKDDKNIRFCLARNPGCPIDVQKKLIEDDHVYNFHTQNYDEERRWSDTLPRAISKNKGAAPEVLAMLANNEDITVRANVANHPNTPKATLNRLLDDHMWKVREAALMNPNAGKTKVWFETARKHILKKVLPLMMEQYYVSNAMNVEQLLDACKATGIDDSGDADNKSVKDLIAEMPENMDPEGNRRKLWEVVIELTKTQDYLKEFENENISKITLSEPNTGLCESWQEGLFFNISTNTGIHDNHTLRRIEKMIALYKTRGKCWGENYLVLYHSLFYSDNPVIFQWHETTRLLRNQNLTKVHDGETDKMVIDGDKLYYDNEYHPTSNTCAVYHDEKDNKYKFVTTDEASRIEHEESFDSEDEAYMKLYNYVTRLDRINKKQ